MSQVLVVSARRPTSRRDLTGDRKVRIRGQVQPAALVGHFCVSGLMASRSERGRKAVRRRKGRGGMPPSAQIIHPFRVIVFDEGDVMCAQILEHDMAVHGRSLEEINVRLRGIITTHVLACAELGRKPFADTQRAPAKYWDWFKRAEKLATVKWEMPHMKPRVEIPAPEIRIAAAVNA